MYIILIFQFNRSTYINSIKITIVNNTNKGIFRVVVYINKQNKIQD
jgi:hypothetical protein